jgi:hypothetical protein
MRYVVAFARFWYDFIVGDDWRIAVGVVATVAVVYFATHRGADVWWLLPCAVLAFLTISVMMATRVQRR